MVFAAVGWRAHAYNIPPNPSNLKAETIIFIVALIIFKVFVLHLAPIVVCSAVLLPIDN